MQTLVCKCVKRKKKGKIVFKLLYRVPCNHRWQHLTFLCHKNFIVHFTFLNRLKKAKVSINFLWYSNAEELAAIAFNICINIVFHLNLHIFNFKSYMCLNLKINISKFLIIWLLFNLVFAVFKCWDNHEKGPKRNFPK